MPERTQPYGETFVVIHHCSLCLLAGTGAELHGKTARETHAEIVEPLMLSHAGLWPEHVRSFAAFAHALGMVQSRTFHLHAENWLTGSTSDGEVCCLTVSPATHCTWHMKCARKCANCYRSMPDFKASRMQCSTAAKLTVIIQRLLLV